jgi:hypothetical protein
MVASLSSSWVAALTTPPSPTRWIGAPENLPEHSWRQVAPADRAFANAFTPVPAPVRMRTGGSGRLGVGLRPALARRLDHVLA